MERHTASLQQLSYLFTNVVCDTTWQKLLSGVLHSAKQSLC